MARLPCPRWTPAATLALVGLARADLPPGFTRTLLSDQVGEFTCLAPVGDARLIVAARNGYITLVQPGQPTIPILQLPAVVLTDEHGVLGLTADPGFTSSGYFYLYYTGPGPYNLIARYTLVNNAVDPASRTVIWQNPDLCPGASHQGGGLAFGPDGNLYVATGDQFDTPSNAQTLANQHGKILRLAPDGSIPPDNPFLGTPGAQPAIWAYGLRNPFRLTIDQTTGSLWLGDVGEGAWEELDRGSAAANYGWPFMEGPVCSIPSCAAFTPPVHAYAHGDPNYAPNFEAAVIAGPIYRGTAFPPEYRSNLFYADHINGWIRRLVFDAAGGVAQDLVFDSAPSVRTIVDLKLGPDGALYYGTIQESTSGPVGVYRIAATQGGNQPPVVVAGAAPLQGDPPLQVQFDSAGTHDPDNGPQPLSFLWEFGDGQTSLQPSPTHQYPARGLFQARLTVSDGADPVASAPIPITVGHAPVPTITAPSNPPPYRAGDLIEFAGIATDFEDGELPAAAFSWSIALVHLNHNHPFIGPIVGTRAGSFIIPTTGHDPENTRYRIDLTVRDSDNIPALVSLDLTPRSAPLDLTTSPPGIPVFLDGRALSTPRLYQSLSGFHHQIRAQPTFILGGVTYAFERWSNNQPAAFAFTTPDAGLALTASYTIVCYANCDGSTIAPILNISDFSCFLNRFVAADPWANCDASTTPPILNISDFSCFLNAYAAGCP